MTPLEVGPAIERLLMLTASASDDRDADGIEAALAGFDGPEARRELVWNLIGRVVEKMPDGGALLLTDEADMIALGLIQLLQAAGTGLLSDAIDAMPDPLVAAVAVSLVGFWHAACAQVAERELHAVSIPDAPDSEPSR